MDSQDKLSGDEKAILNFYKQDHKKVEPTKDASSAESIKETRKALNAVDSILSQINPRLARDAGQKSKQPKAV